MYEQSPPPGETRWRVPRAGWRGIGVNVWALGVTSFVTDISSEMVTSVLPVYIVLHLQMTPLAFGAVDGLYQAAAAAVRLASGVVADRTRHHKAVAIAGYGLSALARLGYVAATAWPAFLAVVSLDRLGKGIRTAPRDALIAAASVRDRTATAFGVHRTLDAAGTAIGPLAAFAILMAVPGRYDQVFLASFVFALVGVAALALLVHAPRAPGNGRPRPLAVHLHDVLRAPGFRRVTLAALVVSIATVSDGLLYLVLQRQVAFPAAWVTLLFVGTPAAFFMLAGPCGALADRVGAWRVFLAGHVALLLAYAVLWLGSASMATIGLTMALLGTYYAATDGVLPAIASRALPGHVRASGLGLLATCTTAARGAAALAFGALWTYTATRTALGVFAAALVVGLAAAGWLLSQPAPQEGPA